jgi:UDP-N-acetylglucosamine 2-epimerase
MKTLLVVGARPQFIKAAAIIHELMGKYPFKLLHTGQHYDENMCAVFFNELGIPEPDVNLGIHAVSRGAMIGSMLIGLEAVITREQPDWVLVFGDTNSTLAGALASTTCGIRLVHLEAGLRSYNRQMPEEINRVLTDHISDLLFCPSQTAVDNLAKEGIQENVHLVGDLMMDTLLAARERAFEASTILEQLGLIEKGYLVATIHRAENTQDRSRLEGLLQALLNIQEPVVFPLHPRTRKALDQFGLSSDMRGDNGKNLRIIEPQGYLDMVRLISSARTVLTDSGGLQKEAYWLGIPCITMRDETEWVETVQAGWNILAGTHTEKLIHAVRGFVPPSVRPALYGDGHAAKRCLEIMLAS